MNNTFSTYYTVYDRPAWVYNPYTGEKVTSGQHIWYIVDSCLTRNFRKFVIMDVIGVLGLIALFTTLLIHPSLTLGIERMEAHYSTFPDSAQVDYYRNTLYDYEAEFYDEALDAMLRCKDGIDAPKGMSKSDVMKIIESVKMDHPEIFWTARWVVHGFNGNCGVIFEYIITDPEEITRKANDYEQIAYNVIYDFASDYDPDSNEYKSELAKYLYGWVCENASYVSDSGNGYDQTIMGVFEGNGCVCAGYSRAYKYLCDKAGIPCYYVSGSTSKMSRDSTHAWNIVAIDGEELHYVDVTWGDDDESNIDWCWYTEDETTFEKSHKAISLDVNDIC